MKEQKQKHYRKCRYCERTINSGGYCSYCKDRVDILREIKALILNKAKQDERRKKNRERQMRYMW